MTPSDPEEKRSATAEAARWLIALEEDPDDAALRARFEVWLAESPANAEAWTNTSEVYAMMAKIPPVHADQWADQRADQRVGREAAQAPAEDDGDDAAASANHDARPAPPRARPRRAGRRSIGRRLLGAALAAWLVFNLAPPLWVRLQADHLTAAAESESIRLDDGSQVHLAPASAVNIEPGGRRVRLIKGEAFFEASPADRPFTVTVGKLRATALGTAFNVRRGKRSVTVAVGEGRVRVEQAPLAAELTAGDWLHVGPDGAVRRGTAPVEEAGAWRRGLLIARDRPLAGLVDDLRRYYAGQIVLTNHEFGRLRVSGVFRPADPAAALQAIAAAHGGAVSQLSPWILLVSPR